MTLAITAAPLSSERRDMIGSGTRAVVSSQQLMDPPELVAARCTLNLASVA